MKIYEYENLVKVFFDDKTNMSFSRKKYGTLLDMIIEQVTKEKIKIRNPYKINEDGSVTMLYFNQKTNEVMEFLLDYDDWLVYREQYWTIYCSGYVVSRTNGKKVNLHREIVGLGDFKDYSQVVDHINHNPLDNRRSNLRIVTQKLNNYNSSLTYKRNSSTGVKGITSCEGWKKAGDNKFRVRLKMLDGSTFTKFVKTYEEAENLLIQKRKENGFCV